MRVVIVVVRAQQKLAADFDRFFGERRGKLVVVDRNIRLDRVGHHVHPRVRRDRRRNGLDQLFVQDRFVRDHAVLRQRVLHAFVRVGDDGERRDFAASAGRGGDRDQARAEPRLGLRGEFAHRFRQIDRAAAADGDHALRPLAQRGGHAVDHFVQRRVGHHVVEHGERDVRLFEPAGHLPDQSAGDDKRVGQHHHFAVFQRQQPIQRVFAEGDSGIDFKIFQRVSVLSPCKSGFSFEPCEFHSHYNTFFPGWQAIGQKKLHLLFCAPAQGRAVWYAADAETERCGRTGRNAAGGRGGNAPDAGA